MLKEHSDEALIELSVREMMEYTLQQSDNNVSNVMFDRILSVGETNDFIRNATGINGFELKHTEGEMRRNHSLCDEKPLDTACMRPTDKNGDDRQLGFQTETRRDMPDYHRLSDRDRPDRRSTRHDSRRQSSP